MLFCIIVFHFFELAFCLVSFLCLVLCNIIILHCNTKCNSFEQKYKKVRKKYKDKLGTKKCELLDLYYGIEDTPKTIMEIAKIYDEDYIKIHDLIRDAKTYG